MKYAALALALLIAACSREEGFERIASAPHGPAPAPLEEPMRVGGDVKPPVAIFRVEPDLSGLSYVEQPFKMFEAIITKDGTVRNVRSLRGEDEVTKRIEAALRQWKFKPATLHGKPVAVIYNLTVNIHVR